MSDQPNHKASRTRDGKGRYDRSPDTAERDAEAARLRAQSLTYKQIGDQLGITKGQAYEAVQRALRDTLEEPAEDVRRLELERLDELARHARQVLANTHYAVSQGRVVRLVNDGPPLEDDGPALAAIDRLLKIQERRAKLLGLDAPTRAEVGGKLSYEIVGVDMDQL